MFRRQLLRQARSISHRATTSLQSPIQRQTCQFSSLVANSARPASISTSYHSRRWQSTDAEPAKDKSEPAASGDGSSNPVPEAPAADASKQEIEKLKKEVIDLKDKYLRSVADYRNLQDRAAREKQNTQNFAIQRFATDLLDSIDNLDRAMSSVPPSAVGQAETSTTSNTSSADPNKAAATESTATPNKDLLNLYNGLKMSDSIMMGVLKKHGIQRFDPLEREGSKFDPNLDEATFFTKVEGKQDGEVFYTQSKGYTLNGRVIRAAKVGVVKNS